MATVLIAFASSSAAAIHTTGCFFTSADTFSAIPIILPGDVYYLEERDNPLGFPVPGSGFLFGEGSWLYREANDLPWLQRGGIGLLGDWFPPGCDQNWHPSDWTIPCLLINEDPVNDETCEHGPDQIITALRLA